MGMQESTIQRINKKPGQNPWHGTFLHTAKNALPHGRAGHVSRLVSTMMLLASSIFFLPSASANIYSFKDENGVTHFSNLPHLDRRYKLVYKIPDSWKTRPNAWTPNFPKLVDIGKLVPIIDNAAKSYGVDPRLIHAVIRAESGYNERAVSNKGAVGLMQIIPSTGEMLGVKNLHDPVENIFGGTRYLSQLLKMFNGNMELALAGYNAGENAVIKYGHRIPPYAETQAYVPKVMAFYKSPELNKFVSPPAPVPSGQPAASTPVASAATKVNAR